MIEKTLIFTVSYIAVYLIWLLFWTLVIARKWPAKTWQWEQAVALPLLFMPLTYFIVIKMNHGALLQWGLGKQLVLELSLACSYVIGWNKMSIESRMKETLEACHVRPRYAAVVEAMHCLPLLNRWEAAHLVITGAFCYVADSWGVVLYFVLTVLYGLWRKYRRTSKPLDLENHLTNV